MSSEDLVLPGEAFKYLRITPLSEEYRWAAYSDSIYPDPSLGGITSAAVLFAGATGPYIVDSTVLVVHNKVQNQFNLNFSNGTTGQSGQYAASYYLGGSTGISANCLVTSCPPNNLPGCTGPYLGDGVLQFITQLCASPSISYLADGLTLRITVPNFPGQLVDGCPVTAGASFLGVGNYNPLAFNLGSCSNQCAAVVSLVYIGAPAPDGLSPTGDNYYNVSYAPVKFTLAHKNYKPASFKNACYLTVAPAKASTGTTITCFEVYFGQVRACSAVDPTTGTTTTLYLLVVSDIIDLACLYWSSSLVYVITTSKTLHLPV